jgi:NAD(P)-dependent dehydrogenase (short-subunit alcohol dehydrogenase family)
MSWRVMSRRVNAVEPGFTATDFAGGRPVEESAEVVVRMATIGRDGPTGTFQEDDHELPW